MHTSMSRAAAATARVVIAALLAALATSCGGGLFFIDDGVHPFELDAGHYFHGPGSTGHYGPAWGRINGEEVLVFRWGRIPPPTQGSQHRREDYYRGSLYVVREDGTGLELLSPTVGDFSWVGEGIAFDTSPAVSPDGTRVAYVTLRHGNGSFNIVTTTLDGGELRQLTLGTRSGRVPAWSPDGTRIAYLVRDRLHTMAADGLDVRVVAPGRSVVLEPPAWSPDGTRLAFRSRDEALYIASADGPDVRQVAEGVGNRPLWTARPVWSPDGQRIAFLEEAGGLPSGYGILHVLDVDTGTVKRLVAGAFGPLIWSPDGTEIYGLRVQSGGDERGLLAVSIEGKPRIRLVAPPVHDVRGMAWSPDGTRLAVRMEPYSRCPSCLYSNVVLYTVAPDGSDPRVLVRVRRDRELEAGRGAAR